MNLTSGQAFFDVRKDAERPFLVAIQGVTVRAVGTAFNVLLDGDSVDVIVTEGTVSVYGSKRVPAVAEASGTENLPDPMEVTRLSQNQAARVRADDAAQILVTDLAPADISDRLAWQESLLRIGGIRLGELSRDFERLTGHRMVIRDQQFASMRIGGRHRSDDVEGFVRILRDKFGVPASILEDGTVVIGDQS
ncbi:MAG: hypothetical protein HC841_04800 [Verrucomicrobiae bacterium]|nr:hypothetical protein [Verrucomicrobiae bacterium]